MDGEVSIFVTLAVAIGFIMLQNRTSSKTVTNRERDVSAGKTDETKFKKGHHGGDLLGCRNGEI